MRQFGFERLVGGITLTLGFLNIVLNYWNWEIWKGTSKYLERGYDAGVLKYVTISGGVLWFLQVVLFFYKERQECLRGHVKVSPQEALALAHTRLPFNYYPTTWRAGMFLMWDISNLVMGAVVNLPVMVFANDLGSVPAECAALAKFELGTEIILATVALSMLNSTWLFCLSVFWAVWNFTLPAERILDPNQNDNTCHKIYLACWYIFLLAFSLSFLVLALVSTNSKVVDAVIGIIIFFILSLLGFLGNCFVFPKVFVAWVGAISCIVFTVVIIVGSMALRQLVANIGENPDGKLVLPVCVLADWQICFQYF